MVSTWSIKSFIKLWVTKFLYVKITMLGLRPAFSQHSYFPGAFPSTYPKGMIQPLLSSGTPPERSRKSYTNMFVIVFTGF